MARMRTAMLIVTWIVLLAGLPARGGADGDKLPRYQLKPGMVLTYKGRANLKLGKATYLEEMGTIAYVVRRNPNGSWRIVIRIGSRLSEAAGPDAGKTQGKQQFLGVNYNLGYFDLFPDGSIGPDAEIGPALDPAIVFPRLPADSATSEWTSKDLRTGEEYSYSSLQRDTGGWAFHAERLGPWKKVYGTTFASAYHFDQGRVVGAEQEFSQEFGTKDKGLGKVELKGVETKDAAWMTAFAPAADRFITAVAAYKKTVRAASKDAMNCRSMLVDAKSKLQAAREATHEPIFREEFDRTLARHDAKAKACMESAQQRAAVVGKTSPGWTLQGLDGKQHSLADYRGKVVVLDFWYRGCGWCVKAMPEMNAVAQRFHGRPVVVLGMNTDAKEEDARFVTSVMGLKYQTLRAQGLQEKYGIQSFPTVIVIGPDGIIRDLQSGYSPTLAVDLGRTIDGILARKR